MSGPRITISTLLGILVAAVLLVLLAGRDARAVDRGADGVLLSCEDFATRQQAEEYYQADGGLHGRNVDGLDADRDGVPCESLPTSAPAPGQMAVLPDTGARGALLLAGAGLLLIASGAGVAARASRRRRLRRRHEEA